MNSVKNIIELLSKRQRKGTVVIFFLMAISGVVEVLSLLSITPFLAVAANPEVIYESEVLQQVYSLYGASDNEDFLMFLGLVVLFIILFSNAFNAILTWFQLRLVASIDASLSTKLFRHYLLQPYSFYLKNNTSDLQAYIQTEVKHMTSFGIMPVLQIIQKTVAIILIISAVVITDPLAAFFSGLVLVVFYSIVFLYTKKTLAQLGVVLGKTNKARYKIVNEAFSTIKLSKIHNLEDEYIKRFEETIALNSSSMASQKIISMLPRFALESIVFILMIFMVLYLISTHENLVSAIPIIGFYAFAALRLMPAVQLVFSNFSMMQFGWPRVDEVYSQFKSGSSVTSVSENGSSSASFNKPTNSPFIKVDQVSYFYPDNESATIKDVSFTINKNTTVGFCGGTGAGKSTVVDLIIGILKADEGCVFVYGQKLDRDNLGDWYRRIGYVPQEIKLLDATIAENVALGTTPDCIDYEKVRHVCSMAHISDHIQSLPDDYHTTIGENGVRLSGGQRQRLGIARALYRDPELLIFDEATSNLDPETEMLVMRALQELAHTRTIVLIAHRLETLRYCDEVIEMSNGKIGRVGTYEKVIEAKIV